MSGPRTVDRAERRPETPAPAGTAAAEAVRPRAATGGDSARSIPPEQLLYARILATGMYTGLFLLLLTFGLYITGVVEPAIPIDRLPEFWTLGVSEYLHEVNAQFLHHDHILTGWAWVSVLERGDYLNFVGIVVLSTVTLVCFLGIIPTLFRKRDYAYTAIAVLETLILALAASGVLTAGGH